MKFSTRQNSRDKKQISPFLELGARRWEDWLQRVWGNFSGWYRCSLSWLWLWLSRVYICQTHWAISLKGILFLYISYISVKLIEVKPPRWVLCAARVENRWSAAPKDPSLSFLSWSAPSTVPRVWWCFIQIVHCHCVEIQVMFLYWRFTLQPLWTRLLTLMVLKMDSLEFSVYKTMPSVNRDSFTSFPTWMVFISFFNCPG